MTFTAVENAILLPPAFVGLAYEVGFSVNGATAGVLTTSAGSTQTGKVALPTGLAYGATGRITGTPVNGSAGTYLLSVKVTDGTSTVDNIAMTLSIYNSPQDLVMIGEGPKDPLN